MDNSEFLNYYGKQTFEKIVTFTQSSESEKSLLFEKLKEQKNESFSNVKKMLFQGLTRSVKDKKTLKDFIITNKIKDIKELNKFLQNNSSIDSELMKLIVKYEIMDYEEISLLYKEAQTEYKSLWDKLNSSNKITQNSLILILKKEYNYNETSNNLNFPLSLFMLKNNIIDKNKLIETYDSSNKSEKNIFEILSENNTLNFNNFAELLSKKLSLKYVKPDLKQVSKDLLKLIPIELCRESFIIPLMKEKDFLFIGMVNPFLSYVLPKIKRITKLIPKVLIIDYNFYKTALNLHPEIEKHKITSINAELLSNGEILNLTIPEIVNKIVETAIDTTATDIHIEYLENVLRIRYRIDGMLHDLIKLPLKYANSIISRIKVMSDLDISKTFEPQDGHISTLIKNNRKIDLRVGTIPTLLGEKVVLRVIDQERVMLGIDQIGFEDKEQQEFEELVLKSQGIILVTGPVGSGKSTTLYATLNRLNLSTKNIITIEDPVEYKLPKINQVQVNAARNITFHKGLRAILRQDPDIIMVGEIRDNATADVAIRAAMTGTLVLSTLHANNAIETISTLQQLKIESFLIANSVVGILAQRLVRKICPHCREQKIIDKKLAKQLNLPNDFKHYYGKGCSICYNTGYLGRTAIVENFIIDKQVSELITQNKTSQEIYNYVKENHNFRNLKEIAMIKISKGMTTPEEIFRMLNY